MADFDYLDLLPHIQPQVQSAPIPLILSVMQRVITDFCRRSTAYRVQLTDINITSGQAVYDIAPLLPVGTLANAIVVAKHNGVPLDPTSDFLDAHASDSGTPVTFQLVGQSVRLSGTPRVSLVKGLSLLVALHPSMLSQTIDAAFMEDYYMGIVDGTLSTMLRMSGQQWNNPSLADYFHTQFEIAIVDAKSRANADNTAKVRVTSYGGL